MTPKTPKFKKERTGPRGRKLREQVRELDLDEEARREAEEVEELDEIVAEWARWIGRKVKEGGE